MAKKKINNDAKIKKHYYAGIKNVRYLAAKFDCTIQYVIDLIILNN